MIDDRHTTPMASHGRPLAWKKRSRIHLGPGTPCPHGGPMSVTTTATAYDKDDLSTPEVALNLVFLRSLEQEVRKLSVFDHPFLVRFSKGVYSGKGMRWALIQFGK